MSFLIFLIFLFWTNPRRHSFYSRIHIVSVHSPFSEKTFFNKHTSRKGSTCRSISALIFHKFSWLFRHRFSHRFFIDFWWKMAPKWHQNLVGRTTKKPYFSRPFRLCWFYVDFMLNLAHLGLPFGVFWCPLAHFWFPLAHFWLTFGALWLTFGALGFFFVILALVFLVFGTL